MESRIQAISTHALIESAASYGLAVTGKHVSQQVMDRIDTGALNIAARKIVGSNISARKEILFAISDIKNVYNHYIAKTANMLDRVLRSTNAAAQESAWKFIDKL